MAVFSSTLPQTPKQSHFDDQQDSGWTPRFAEEYSVFNSTPGNLRGSSSSDPAATFDHLDFAPLSPVPPSTADKCPLSDHFPAASAAATLAPVDPAPRRLAPPVPLIPAHEDGRPKLGGTTQGPSAQKQARSKLQSPSLPHQQQPPQPPRGQWSVKKSRKWCTLAHEAAVPTSPSKENAAPPPTQTATPPPSSRGGRKLVPRLPMENMQGQSFGRAGFSGAAQPHLDTSFVTGHTEDVFGYALGGPATAPPMTGPRPFWGMDMNMSGMSIDVDLVAAGADLFQTTPAQNAPVFEPTGMVARPEQGQLQQPPSQSQGQGRRKSSKRRDRPLAPKTATMSASSLGQTIPSQDFTFESFQVSMDGSFGMSPGGVDPGLLIGPPITSAGMDSGLMSMTTMPLAAAPSLPTSSAPTTAGVGPELAFTGAPMDAGHSRQRRFSEIPPRAISPAKDGGNPLRSSSENARSGKRTVGGGRNRLPALAPAKPATVSQPRLPPNPNPNSRPPTANGSQPGGRTSLSKPSHHHRLSSLTSIPENVANFPSRSSPRAGAKGTSVKLVIDENGRARTETVRDGSADEDRVYYDAPEPLLPSFSASQQSWGGSVVLPTAGHQAAAAVSDEEAYSSSEDDEPIIIPSRNTSYSYPEPPRSSGVGRTHSRPPTASSIPSHGRVPQHPVSDRPPTSSSSSFRRGPPNQHPDDAEDDMMRVDHQRPPRSRGSSSGGRPSTGGSLGDAAAELRKVMQGVTPRRTNPTPQPLRLGSNGPSRQKLTPGQRSSSSTISEASLPPAGASPTQMDQIRCVCNRTETEVDGVQFLVKWYVLLVLHKDFLLVLCLLFFLFCFVWAANSSSSLGLIQYATSPRCLLLPTVSICLSARANTSLAKGARHPCTACNPHLSNSKTNKKKKHLTFAHSSFSDRPTEQNLNMRLFC